MVACAGLQQVRFGEVEAVCTCCCFDCLKQGENLLEDREGLKEERTSLEKYHEKTTEEALLKCWLHCQHQCKQEKERLQQPGVVCWLQSKEELQEEPAKLPQNKLPVAKNLPLELKNRFSHLAEAEERREGSAPNWQKQLAAGRLQLTSWKDVEDSKTAARRRQKQADAHEKWVQKRRWAEVHRRPAKLRLEPAEVRLRRQIRRESLQQRKDERLEKFWDGVVSRALQRQWEQQQWAEEVGAVGERYCYPESTVSSEPDLDLDAAFAAALEMSKLQGPLRLRRLLGGGEAAGGSDEDAKSEAAGVGGEAAGGEAEELAPKETPRKLQTHLEKFFGGDSTQASSYGVEQSWSEKRRRRSSGSGPARQLVFDSPAAATCEALVPVTPTGKEPLALQGLSPVEKLWEVRKELGRLNGPAGAKAGVRGGRPRADKLVLRGTAGGVSKSNRRQPGEAAAKKEYAAWEALKMIQCMEEQMKLHGDTWAFWRKMCARYSTSRKALHNYCYCYCYCY